MKKCPGEAVTSRGVADTGKGADMAERTCDVDGCDNLHRARGLCSTHYNRRHVVDAHPKVPVPCAWCDRECLKEPSRASRYQNLYCSDRCKGDHYAALRPRKPAPQRIRELVHVGPPTYRHVPESHPARVKPPSASGGVFVSGACRRCGSPFTVLAFNPDNLASFCSFQCLRAAGKARRRAAKHDAYVEPVYRAKVFTRDGWRCQLCQRLIPARYRDPQIARRYAGRKLPDLAPVIDHVIPLADGGEHSMANTQCAHFRCNSIKGAGVHGDGEQLRMLAPS